MFPKLTKILKNFLLFLLQPERIDPKNFGRGYDVRSDVWSLGITLVSSILCVFLHFKKKLLYADVCITILHFLVLLAFVFLTIYCILMLLHPFNGLFFHDNLGKPALER